MIDGEPIKEVYKGEYCSWMMAAMYPDCQRCQELKALHDKFEKEFPPIEVTGMIAREVFKPRRFEGLESGCP